MPLHRLLLALAVLPPAFAALQLSFGFTQQQCASNLFFEDANQVGPLSPSQNGSVSCPSSTYNLHVFPEAGIGLIGEASSQWTISNLVDNGSFVNNVFTIAVWFTVQAPSNPCLVRFGNRGQFTLCSQGASMQLGNGTDASAWGTLPQTALDQVMPNQVNLLVFTANVTQALFYRANMNGSQATSFFTTFPDESALQVTSVVVPRITAWEAAPLIVGTLGETLTTILKVEVADSALSPSNFASQQLPFACPSVTSFSVNVTENQNFAVNLAPYMFDINGAPLTVSIAQTPKGGFVSALSPTNVTYQFNPSITVHPVIDSFVFYASNAHCPSVVVATCTIYVKPVDHPPVAGSVSIFGIENQTSPIVFSATDPDGDNDIAYYNLKGTVGLYGSIVYCSNKTTPNISSHYTPVSGLCYLPDFAANGLDKASGSLIVGEETIYFSVFDRSGLSSAVLGQIGITLYNPGYVNITLVGPELAYMWLNATISYSSLLLVSNPEHGFLSRAAEPNVPLVVNQWTRDGAFYQSQGTYFGSDAFQIQFITSSGFLSPINTVQVLLSDTYHASVMQAPSSLAVTFSQLTDMNISLSNVDGDSYSSVLSLEMSQSSGLISISDIPLAVDIVQGAGCVHVGCASIVVLRGVPAMLAQSLLSAQYMAIATVDNSIGVLLYDEPRAGEDWLVFNQTISISVQGGIWGSSDPFQRGNAGIGAGIIGSIIACLIVFGRGVWVFLPTNWREWICNKFTCRRASDSDDDFDKTSSSTTGLPPKVLIRPPSKNRILDAQASEAKNPDALMDCALPPPPPPPGLPQVSKIIEMTLDMV